MLKSGLIRPWSWQEIKDLPDLFWRGVVEVWQIWSEVNSGDPTHSNKGDDIEHSLGNLQSRPLRVGEVSVG